MQTAKNAAASIKETAANIGASAKSGMEKTKATLQEKFNFLVITDMIKNWCFSSDISELGGATGSPMGSHQMSALPGHGTGQPAGNVVEGVVKSHPIGKDTGTGTTLAGHNLNAGGATGAGGYSTGGAYR
ncbi:18 kDa seed maturation protein [Artemisia annua]|uniref:18 kDa seed maturation protein n=1 Tax=Artemisia annua TaxID=35608 RepID=A0A2U1KD87_ARTAN|nr:18 kDa seed maturation protein [Artemisia annua]